MHVLVPECHMPLRLEYWVMCKRTVLYYVYKNAAHMHAPMSACMYMWHNYYVNIM